MRYFAFFITVFFTVRVYSQCDNSFFHLDKFDRHLDSSQWQFSADNFSYFRNLEQQSAVDKGVTYIGTQLTPKITYQINKDAQIAAGAFFRYDFGNPQLKTILPYFQFNYSLWNHKIIFGNLEGNVQHKLVEPIFDYERAITKAVEQGAQLKKEGKRLSYDVWIDWEKMIYEGSPFNESFFGGLNIFYTPINNEKHKLRLNTQAITLHRAGEIDNSVEANSMQYNFAHGIDYQYSFNKNTEIFASFHGVYYEDQSGFLAANYIDGLGQLAVLRLRIKDYRFVLNYWDGHEFQAPLGEQLYGSMGNKNWGNPIQVRKMATFRIVFEKQITDRLSFLNRLGINYNIDHQATDIIMENYLRWNIASKGKSISLF